MKDVKQTGTNQLENSQNGIDVPPPIWSISFGRRADLRRYR
jgi:hypothetical protein